MCFHIGNLNLDLISLSFGFSLPWFSFNHQPQYPPAWNRGTILILNHDTNPKSPANQTPFELGRLLAFQRLLLIGFGIGFFAPPLSSPTSQPHIHIHTQKTHQNTWTLWIELFLRHSKTPKMKLIKLFVNWRNGLHSTRTKESEREESSRKTKNSQSTNESNRKWNSICKSNQIEIRSQSTAYTKI